MHVHMNVKKKYVSSYSIKFNSIPALQLFMSFGLLSYFFPLRKQLLDGLN
jgi:hypothetical protein